MRQIPYHRNALLLLLVALFFSYSLLAQQGSRTIVSLNNNWLSVAYDSLEASMNGFEKASYKPAQCEAVSGAP